MNYDIAKNKKILGTFPSTYFCYGIVIYWVWVFVEDFNTLRTLWTRMCPLIAKIMSNTFQVLNKGPYVPN